MQSIGLDAVADTIVGRAIALSLLDPQETDSRFRSVFSEMQHLMASGIAWRDRG